MLRVVVDTNILISGFLWAGLPGRVLDAAFDRRFQLIASPEIVNELHITLSRIKFEKRIAAMNSTVDQFIASFESFAEIATPTPIEENFLRDPKDVMILACAIGGRADCVVTGDQDLLVINSYRGVSIWTAGRLLTLLAADEN